jgi:hypothetical protein
MFNLKKSQKPVDAQIASQEESQWIEVSGLMDDFVSIEEFAPGSDREDVLAATWGIPCVQEPARQSAFMGLKELGRRSLRSVLHSIRTKKFEIA